MPANFDALNVAVQEMVAEVTVAEGIDQSAIALLNGIEAMINEALAADNAIDNASTAAAQAVVTGVITKLKTSNAALAAAIAAHQPPPPPPA